MVMKNRHRSTVIVGLNWFERRQLNRDWDRKTMQLKDDVNPYLWHSIIESVVAYKAKHGTGLSLVEFTARRHIEI